MKRTRLSTLTVAVLMALYGGSNAHAGCTAVAGNQASPFQAGVPNPDNGFAEFVTDSSSSPIALQLCLDAANCFFDPVIPGNLFSEQIGFGAEAFFWSANASIDTLDSAGTPILSAILVLATEAAFLTEPMDGEQFPFTRLRIRVDVPQPGIYKVTHPYGTEEFTVDAVGAGQEIRTSADIQFTPGAFDGTGAPQTTQNQGCVGPWLQWDPAESDPPVGFIGDGATPHTVIGSPTGNNYFEISATDLNGNPIPLDADGNDTVRTNLFTVLGQLYDGTLATPLVSNRTTYERDATATSGQVDVFATSVQAANVTFTGGPNLPAGDIPLTSDPNDPRVARKFFASVGMVAGDGTPDATVVPPVVAINAVDAQTPTDPTRLLRLVTDVVTITKAQYNLSNHVLSVDAVSSDNKLTPQLTVAEYGVSLPAQIVTDAPPATVNVTSAVGGTAERQVAVVDNVPPVANGDSVSTDEDVPVTFDVTANDTTAVGTIDPASVAIINGPANGTAVSNGDGTITYTPNPDFNGSDSLTYTVQNDTGAVSNVATVSITVIPVNDAPVAAADSASTGSTTPVTIPVLANDTDVDIATNGDTLSVSAVSPTTNGTAVINADNTITYTPDGTPGTVNFTYTVADSGGRTATAVVTVDVVDTANGAPTPANDNFTVAEDSGATALDVLANDTDPEGDALTITAVTQPANGTVVNNGTTVSFTPAPNFNGTTSFGYTVDDGNGNTAAATVTVTVTPVNDVPVAGNDTFTVAEDSGATTLSVLANDTDADGDALTITAVTQPANGTVVNNGTTVSFTPAPNFNGSTSFSYTIDDGNGGTATANVTVGVTPMNDAPVAANDSASTDSATSVTIPVLANDTDVDIATNGGALSVTSVTQPSNGSVVINGDNTVTYTPNGTAGTFTFTYTVTDSGGLSSTATVTVDVTAAGVVTTLIRGIGRLLGF